MTAVKTSDNSIDRQAGTARLPIVVPVAVISFFYASILEYSLPLYFGALSDAAEAAGGSYPADIWSTLVKYQVTPWIIGPILAGLLARRYGERVIWSGALLGKMVVPLLLAIAPNPNMIKGIALWQGFTGALMWIAGVSLIQMVAPEKKGLSNGLMMASLGVGSVFGPVIGRALLYRHELGSVIADGNWPSFWAKLFSFEPTVTTPVVADFQIIFWLLTASTLVCGLLIGLWGQRPGRFDRHESHGWSQTWKDIRHLARTPTFWALVLSMCVLGGPVFQASNQFLPYRAEDLGLKVGAADQGWIWLQLLKTLMWIPGGVAVGLLAGRRAPGIAAVIMLGAFSLAALGIGESRLAWQLFCWVALFEFVRQFMRWSHAGYLSEHMPGDLRATAIGCSITFSGLGSTVFAWTADLLWNPAAAGFQSSDPFLAAALLGLVGSAGLMAFDRFVPIRQREG
ncbi:MAG: MFS transporter [Planctomycetes bacterium]|nr:MFS transporter [Planctomycetota bacterium]